MLLVDYDLFIKVVQATSLFLSATRKLFQPLRSGRETRLHSDPKGPLKGSFLMSVLKRQCSPAIWLGTSSKPKLFGLGARDRLQPWQLVPLHIELQWLRLFSLFAPVGR